MDAFTTLLFVAATGVTFDWQPLEGSERGAEYIVQVEPELVEAARRGQLEAIESNIPDGIGPIRRIRVVLGGEKTASEIAGAGGKEHSVLKPTPTVEWPVNQAHTVRQSGAAGQPLTQFTQGLNTAAGQLEQGFQQGTQGLQNGFQQASQAVTGAQNTLTQPFAAQPVADQRRTIGGELLEGVNRVRERTRGAIRKTGEAIQGTRENVRDGLRTVLTGGDRQAAQPAAPGSGGYNPYSYNTATALPGNAPQAAQPALSGFNANNQQGFVSQQPFASSQQPASARLSAATPTGAGQSQGFQSQGFQSSVDPSYGGGANPNSGFASNGTLTAPPLQTGTDTRNFPGGRQTESTTPGRGYDGRDAPQFASETPFVPLGDGGRQRTADELTSSSGMVPVRPARATDNRADGGGGFNNNFDGGFGAGGLGSGGFGSDASSGPLFPQTGGFAGGPTNTTAQMPPANAGTGQGDQGGFAPWNVGQNAGGGFGNDQYATTPTGAQPGQLPPLGQPSLPQLGGPQLGGQPPTSAGGYDPNFPPSTVPTNRPWGWLVFSSLVCFGSIAANFFLGFSYLDARHKYQSALRRTVRTFSRSE